MRGSTILQKKERDKFEERMAFISAYSGDILLSVKEAKIVLGIANDKTIYDLINLGLIKCLVVGSKKIRKSTLDQFIKDYEGQDIFKLINDAKQSIKEGNDECN